MNNKTDIPTTNMKKTKQKIIMQWLLGIFICLFLVSVILYFTGKKSVRHEIFIDAAVADVWSVLTDTAQYPEWNPTMQILDGELKEGNNIQYRFTQNENNQYEVPSTVIKITPNQLLNQSGGTPIILNYDHCYQLEEVEGGTRVTIHEDYRGIFVNFWNPQPVEKAYAKLNQALKERVEALQTKH